MVAGKIQVELKDGKKWVIYIPDKPEYIDVSGTAVLPWLKRGMFVSFTGLFDAKGAPQTEIRDILVFQPNKDTKLGAQRDGVSGANKNLFGGNPNPNAVQTARFIISGRLVNINNGKMVVAAPGFQTTVSLAKKMTIRVKSHNPSLIRVGDKVTVGRLVLCKPSTIYASQSQQLEVHLRKTIRLCRKTNGGRRRKTSPSRKKRRRREVVVSFSPLLYTSLVHIVSGDKLHCSSAALHPKLTTRRYSVNGYYEHQGSTSN